MNDIWSSGSLPISLITISRGRPEKSSMCAAGRVWLFRKEPKLSTYTSKNAIMKHFQHGFLTIPTRFSLQSKCTLYTCNRSDYQMAPLSIKTCTPRVAFLHQRDLAFFQDDTVTRGQCLFLNCGRLCPAYTLTKFRVSGSGCIKN